MRRGRRGPGEAEVGLALTTVGGSGVDVVGGVGLAVGRWSGAGTQPGEFVIERICRRCWMGFAGRDVAERSSCPGRVAESWGGARGAGVASVSKSFTMVSP